MSNKEKFDTVFCEIFQAKAEQLPKLAFGCKNWDSIGHMQMITELEEKFDISISPDDIMQMGTYADAMEVLSKSYGVVF